MGFVLIWRSRCKFRRTGCNASVSGYSIAGFPQSHLCRCSALKRLFVQLLQHNSRFRISHGHLALGSGFCNTSLSGYSSAGGHDVTVLVADCLCNEKCVLQLCPSFLLLYFIASLFFSLYPFLEALNFTSSSLRQWEIVWIGFDVDGGDGWCRKTTCFPRNIGTNASIA